MVDSYGFTVIICARRLIDAVFADLKGQMSELLYSPGVAAGYPAERLQQSLHEAAAQDLGRAEKLAKQYAS